VADSEDRLLQEQIDYYRARAPEYDEWFLRQGRYDHGPELKRRWFAQVEEIAAALATFAPRGRVLELACGTGWWTERLARFADDLTAVDVAPEALALNRARLAGRPVRYLQADLFDWRPEARYDVVFFSFWLSHVPPGRFDRFWGMVRDSLDAEGRVFFIDSAYNETSTAVDHRLEGPDATTTGRRLNDGREYRIVKLFYRPEELIARLAKLGWRVTVQATESDFIYGHGCLEIG
jgi:demethylmenaquinone methyltransferase/2-methoxy-6-polyprenyl-1,4-benzoquinol methylase